MTPAEKILWERLRNRKFKNFKFNRQYPLSYKLMDNTLNWFIVDFYCHQLKLIIEVDGKIHESRIDYDKERDETILNMGYRTIRIKNEEVLERWEITKIKLDDIIEMILNTKSI